MSKRKKVETDAGPLTSNPFAALSLGDVPDAPERDPYDAVASAPTRVVAADAEGLAGRIIVRRQKKGQGGKTVTCIEGLPAARAAELLPRIKRGLGCSGRLDGDTLVAGTGDHRRVATWIEGLGATNVILGN